MKKKTGETRGVCVIKLNISKAYDKIEWSFLMTAMEHMGFSSKWVQRIFRCVSTVCYSFMINGQVKGLVNPSRGLRQGNAISPYVFRLCAEAFSGLLTKAMNEKSLHGIKISGNAPQLSHLLFADDSVLFMRANIEECKRLTDIVSCYESMSRQRINKEKSEVVFSKNLTIDQK